MDRLYAYSLIPVVAVSLLLALTVALRMRRRMGLGIFAAALAIWSGNLLLTYFPPLAEYASRFAASGAFVAAGFLHASYDVIGRSHRGLLAVAYATATIVTTVGFFVPGLLFDPVSLSAGPMFWPGMALAVAGATVPLVFLAKAAILAEDRAPYRWLAASGVLVYGGAWSNAYMLSRGNPSPWGMFLVLAGALLLARVLHTLQAEDERRLLDRSLIYSSVTTFVSAGFLLGIALVVQEGAAPLIGQYGVGAIFLVAMAFVALAPVRQAVQDRLGKTLAPNAADSAGLAARLGEKEIEAAQSARLAEIGTLTSAVAHEVRNPLGVLKAHLKVLERSDAPEATLTAMRDQIDRAGGFVDDLLTYGRPTPLNVREIDVAAIARRAWSTATTALGRSDELDLDVEGSTTIEADAGQLQQVFVVLFENAMLASEDTEIRVEFDRGEWLAVTVSDDGPGVPEQLHERLFEPFVTGRKRGTGLGLAISYNIISDHGGDIQVESEPGVGTTVLVSLPLP
jgi:signal transduction histidine kinase